MSTGGSKVTAQVEQEIGNKVTSLLRSGQLQICFSVLQLQAQRRFSSVSAST